VVAQESAPAEVSGRLNALNAAAGTLTVGATALTSGSETRVLLNGTLVSLADLAVGETAQAQYDPSTRRARQVVVNRPQGWLWGRVTALSAGTASAAPTLTFQRRGGASEVLVIGPTSVIPLEDGTELNSLVGSNGSVWFDPVTKVIDRFEWVPTEPSESDSAPYPPPAEEPSSEPSEEPVPVPVPVRYRANGIVAAVDAAAGTVTLLARCVRAPGAKTLGLGQRLVLSLGNGTELTLDGKPAQLGQLAAGDRVRCLYEARGDQNYALKVRAVMPPVRVAAGLVRALGGGTVAIGSAARPRVLTLTSETFVSVNGVPATADALGVGQRGCALYRERGGAAQALVVVTMTPPAKPARKSGHRR
jgi:hypothetical protein